MSLRRENRSRGAIVALIVLGGALLVWLHQIVRVRTIAGEIQRGRRETVDGVARAVVLARDIEKIQKDAATLQQTLEKSPAPSMPGAPSPPRPHAAFELPALFAEHPEWRAIYRAGEQAAFFFRYGPLAHALGLSEDQRDRFSAELMRHDEQEAEGRMAARQHDWAPDAPQLLALQREENDRHANELTSLLGESGFQRYQEYERTIAMRDLVGDLAHQLYYTATPLAADVAEQLTATLAQHAVNAKGKVDRAALDWDAALAEARLVLAPEQFARLQQVREMADLQRQMNQIVARAARSPKATP